MNWRAGLCLVLVAGLCGCNTAKYDSRPFDAKDDVTNNAPVEEHVHGPHNGHILELGEEEFHAEVVIDATRKLSVYLLDEHVKASKPVENGTVTIDAMVDGKPVALALTATPQDGETDGKSSRFELAADQLPEAIKDIEGLSGKLTLKFGDKTLPAEIGHDHGHAH